MKTHNIMLATACVLSTAACSGGYSTEGEEASVPDDLMARAAAGEELTIDEEKELDQYLPPADNIEPGIYSRELDTLQELVRDAEPPPTEEFGQNKQALLGSGACKDVDIKISNIAYATPIKVLYVEYWDLTDEKWREENLANTELPAGYHAWWNNEDLEYTRGDRIGTWKIFFRYYTGNGTWSSTYYYPKQKPVNDAYGEICVTGKNYELVWDN